MTTTTREYKSYVGSIEVDMERLVLRGKVLFIRDLITFEAASPAALQSEFEAAVDDYLDTCKELGREAMKPMSGSFNVRVDPSDHMRAAVLAAQQGRSLNSLVAQALHVFIEANGSDQPTITVAHEHAISVTVKADETVVVGSKPPTSWEAITPKGQHAH